MASHSSFTWKSLCGDHPLMVILPEGGDEIALAGPAIYQACLEGVPVFCVYLTNGNGKIPPAVSLDETLKGLKVLGVPEENAIFLGYPGSGENGRQSIFLYGRERNEVAGSGGPMETAGTPDHPEFAWQEDHKHHPCTWKSLLRDLQRVIIAHRPGVLMAPDFDKDLDCRSASLAFETVMGRILVEIPDYRPLVLKGFRDGMSFRGPDDFWEPHLHSQKYGREEQWNGFLDTGNPTCRWKDRARFPVAPACREERLPQNVLWQAALCHPSRRLCQKAPRFINGDLCFWLRRTDNLMFGAKVTGSAGGLDRVHDFLHLNWLGRETIGAPVMENYACFFRKNEKDRFIRAAWKTARHVEEVCLYGNIESQNAVLSGRLVFSNGFSLETGGLPEDGKGLPVLFPPQDNVTWVRFEIGKTRGEKAGVSEMEIYEKAAPPLRLLKICADGDFAYDWHVRGGEKPKISCWTYGVEGPINWYIDGERASLEDIETMCAHLKKTITVRAELQSDPSLWDEAVFSPAGLMYRWKQRRLQKQQKELLREEDKKEELLIKNQKQ